MTPLRAASRSWLGDVPGRNPGRPASGPGFGNPVPVPGGGPLTNRQG